MTSPIAQRKNKAPKAPRQSQAKNQPQQQQQLHAEVQSDSNILSAQTPRAKKNRQKPNDNRAVSGSEAPNHRNTARSQRTRPAHDSPAPSLATPAKSMAYASAAFHQSPAASSLPIPKFLSKSMPSAVPEDGLQARLDNEASKQSSTSPSPPAQPSPDLLAREKSPLDMFFQADREEKAKKQTTSHSATVHDSPFMPNRTPTGGNKDMFMMELDNSESPAVSRSARPKLAPSMASAPGNIPTQLHQDTTTAATQSLKDFLKLPTQQQQPSPVQPSPNQLHNPFITKTPQQQQSRPSDPNNSLHYGNRNLSPLFHAARSPNASSPVSTQTPSQARTQSQPFNPRAFLEQQVQSAHQQGSNSFSPVQAPRNPHHHVLSSPHHQGSPNGVPINGYYGQPNGMYHGGMAGSPAQRPPPTNQENADVKDLEAKLRGILKMGV